MSRRPPGTTNLGKLNPGHGGLRADGLDLEPERLHRRDTGRGLAGADKQTLAERFHFWPIRLGPGLLVGLDQMTRTTFLREWDAALTQP